MRSMPIDLHYRTYAASDTGSVAASNSIIYNSAKLTPPAHRFWYVRHITFQVNPSTTTDMSVSDAMFFINKVVTSLLSNTGQTLTNTVNSYSYYATFQLYNGSYIASVEFTRPFEISADMGESVQTAFEFMNGNSSSTVNFNTWIMVDVIETSSPLVLEA